MKSTKQFRVKLFEGSTPLATTLVTLAAMSNGGKTLSIEQLKNVAESECILYPSLNADTQAEIIGDNLLHIDRKIGDDYKTICSIEEVELTELGGVGEEVY